MLVDYNNMNITKDCTEWFKGARDLKWSEKYPLIPRMHKFVSSLDFLFAGINSYCNNI